MVMGFACPAGVIHSVLAGGVFALRIRDSHRWTWCSRHREEVAWNAWILQRNPEGLGSAAASDLHQIGISNSADKPESLA